MNIPELVKSNPIYQAIFAIGSLAVLLIVTTTVRFYAVIERFTDTGGDLESVLSRYTAVEAALLLISLAAVCFIWFVLLQGRIAGPIIFNFKRPAEENDDEAIENNQDFKSTFEQQNLDMLEENQLLNRTLTLGNNLLSINELQPLLYEAVNATQKAFDLYHVQIYLAGGFDRTLNLRAGSGRVGTELVRRGHSLAFGPGSINGTAAQRRSIIHVPDTSTSDLHLSNPLLNRTRSELSLPLMASNSLLGVLNLQSSYIEGFSSPIQKAAAKLADQLAIAIDQAKRIAELKEAQETVREQAARLTRAGWQSWLETIDNTEDLTYYHRPTNRDLNHHAASNDAQNMFIASPVVVSGAEVGNIQIETDSTRQWGLEDMDLVRAVADQLGQKIENLRLLNESERYREEAEKTLQQITHDNWQSEIEQADFAGFQFDGKKVEELEATQLESMPFDNQLGLTIQGEEIGSITISEPVEDEDLELIASVSESLSGHIESLRLTEQTKRRVFELSMLNRVNTAISAELDLFDLIEIVGEELRRGFNASSTFISTYNRASNMMEYPYFMLDNNDGVRRIEEKPRTRGTGFSSQVIQSGKPLLISRNPAEMIRAGALVVDYGDMPHSYLGVPIIFGEEVLGVLSLQNGSNRRLFTENDQKIVESLASSMALALQNTTLFHETQDALKSSEKRRVELEAINTVIADTTSAVAVEEAVDKMAQKLIEVINGELISTTLIQPDNLTLLVVSERTERGTVPDSIGEKFAIDAFEEQEYVIENQKLFSSQESLDSNDHPRLVVLPIIGQSGAIGTVRIEQSANRPGFDTEQIQLAESIVYQVSTVLENKQLLSETRQRALREQKVRSITDRIRKGSDQEEILRIAQEELTNLIGANKSRTWMGPASKSTIPISPEIAE
ncbi:MAG: GAF domain-containing protein [Chloroflexota bacterium]